MPKIITQAKEGVSYLRLSIEDGDDKESTSISNQRKIIEQYAKENNIIITKFYIDDGYSGYTMDRPDFNRLKKDLNDGKVDLIIVKDLSRIGRHSPKVQLFLENILETGKRVIAPGDNYDTLDESTHDMVGIRIWMNERYVVETSKKIRKSLASAQKDGSCVISVPYGYVKDHYDKSKYYVDPMVAPYVKQIFDMYISGMGMKLIARELTERNVPTPAMIKKQHTEARGEVSKRKATTKWDMTAIHKMLNNDFYIGTLTLGKFKNRAINGKQVPVPKEDQHIFKNHHEPIIDEQTFKLVQEIIKSRKQEHYRGIKNQKRPNAFAGLLYCADCGTRMTSANGGHQNTRYICKAYNIYGTSVCTSHSMTESNLTEALLEFLEHCKNNLMNALKDIDQIIQAEMSNRVDHSDSIQELINRLDKAQQAVKIIVEQKTYEIMQNPGSIDSINKIYNDIQNEKYAEIKVLEQQIADMQNIAIDEIEVRKNLNSAISIINNVLATQKVTKKQVLMLVERINVYEDGGLDIYLKGNLHDLCNNYFKVGASKIRKIKELLYEFILKDTDKIVTRNAAFYIREQGLSLTFESLSKIVKEELLEKGIVQRNPMNRGYKLIADVKELERVLLGDNVVDHARWQNDNSVIFKIAESIGLWIGDISYKKTVF